jgi:hypothetical protein
MVTTQVTSPIVSQNYLCLFACVPTLPWVALVETFHGFSF